MIGSSTASVRINIREISPHGIVFEKKYVRAAMRILGGEVQAEARKLVARPSVSQPGDYPGKKTGRLQKAIKYQVSKPGFLVIIAPMDKTGLFKKNQFYPAFLNYGANRKRGGKLAPRANYMADALAAKSDRVRSVLRSAIEKALHAA